MSNFRKMYIKWLKSKRLKVVRDYLINDSIYNTFKIIIIALLTKLSCLILNLKK